MKEQLKTIKNKYFASKESFKRNRLFFNIKVEEKLLEENKIDILQSDGYDSYDNAKFLMNFFPEISDLYKKIKLENPKYGQKRIKKIILDSYQEILGTDLEDYLYGYSFESLVDSYFLYESCGYFKVLEKEQELEKTIKEIENTINNLKNESKNNRIKVGMMVKEQGKQYKDLLKKHFKEIPNTSKKFIHQKSKKLAQTFQKIADKTA